MIRISGKPLDPKTLDGQYTQGSVGRSIIEIMSNSEETYDYDSLGELQFELNLREATVTAARELDRSGMDFAIFRKSKCNADYWSRTDEGGFVLKDNVKPSDAIRDIYQNGSDYATECATAILIVYYKAILDVFPKLLFDQVFSDIELMNWHHIDKNLREIGLMDDVKDYLPGDRMYFMNPDVNPEKPEWQGENVIMLDNDVFYGHGLGIRDEATMIKELNKNRVEGARESAYLMKKASRPDFKKLWGILQAYHP